MSPSTESRENREFAAELKFLVSPPVAEQIRQWARNCLVPDPHGSGEHADYYRISSLYFDTAEFDVFQRNGSYGRSKYRVRRYGLSETVFLERKLKTRGLVSKRRSVVPMPELQRLIAPRGDDAWGGHWFQQRLLLRRLQPVCQISYDRTARVTMGTHGPIRLTLDHNLQAQRLDGLQFQSEAQSALISPDKVIVEMKYRVDLPVLFKKMVEQFALSPQPVSKYRLAMAALNAGPSVPLASTEPMENSICLPS